MEVDFGKMIPRPFLLIIKNDVKIIFNSELKFPFQSEELKFDCRHEYLSVEEVFDNL